MSSSQEIDVQLGAVLGGLKNLRALLDEPLARHALDLANNAKTNEKHGILRRLTKSLTQYSERDGHLFYVGALGHFSSGKSSTINSILDIWGGQSERETGLNPTDETITLITRDTNNGALLGVVREGHVTIRSEFIDIPFLEHIVIADTPGTGDPELFEEIARDFLPLCDLVLFFFSATSPLDKTDVPLLEILHRELPFIPTQFVITRADEFAIDKTRAISEDNLDQLKQSKFLQGVVFRVNKLLQPKIYTESDFLLIDNIQEYNVDAVMHSITAKCNPSDPQNRIAMHSHKVRYFQSSAKHLRLFFEEFLDFKLKELTRIVEAAELNVRRYNENVRISNNNLTKNWFDQLTEIREEREKVAASLIEIQELPADVHKFDSVVKRRAEISREFQEELSRTIQQIVNGIKLDISKIARKELQRFDFTKILSSTDGKRIPGLVDLSSFEIDLGAASPLLPFALASRWSALRDLQAAALRNFASDLRRAMEGGMGLLVARAPWSELQSVVGKAQESLSEDLTRFFSTAELYRAGVFTHTTKESIGALGLGRELDQLESEFSAVDKARFESEAKDGLFPDFEKYSGEYLRDIAAIEDQLRPLIALVRDLKIPSPEVALDTVVPQLEAKRAALQSSLKAALRDDLAHFEQKLASAIEALVVVGRERYEKEMAAARRSRWIRIAVFLAGGVVASFAVYFAYTRLTDEVPQTAFHTVLWNVIAYCITGPISALMARLFDQFPKASRRIRRDAQALLRRDIEKEVERQLETHTPLAGEQNNFMEKLRTSCLELMAFDPDEWLVTAKDRLSTLQQACNKYLDARERYLGLIKSASENVSSYFNDQAHNLQVLNNVADRIKQQAIEPSFEFLENTRKSLEDVKKRIHAVEF